MVRAKLLPRPLCDRTHARSRSANKSRRASLCCYSSREEASCWQPPRSNMRGRTLTQRLLRWWVEAHGAAEHSGRRCCCTRMDFLGGPSLQLLRTSWASSLPNLRGPTPPNTNGKLAPLLMFSFCEGWTCTNKPRCHHHELEHALPLTGAPPHARGNSR